MFSCLAIQRPSREIKHFFHRVTGRSINYDLAVQSFAASDTRHLTLDGLAGAVESEHRQVAASFQLDEGVDSLVQLLLIIYEPMIVDLYEQDRSTRHGGKIYWVRSIIARTRPV